MNKILLTLFVVTFFSISMLAQKIDPEAKKLADEGKSLFKSGQFQGAIEKYDAALAIEEAAQIHYLKGVAQLKLRKREDAIKSFDKSIALNPDFSGSYNLKGSALHSLKRFEEAIENYNLYLEKSTNEKNNAKVRRKIATAYNKLATNAKNDGKHQRAIGYLNEAVKNHKLDSAFLLLAEINIELGKYNEALSAADNAINNKKKISKGAGYFYKGLAFKGLDKKEKAIENFKIAAKDKTYKASSEFELKQLK